MYASDILVHYHEADESVEIFGDEQVAIIRYADPAYGIDPSQAYILIDYATDDTDKDGRLTCNDARSLAVFDLPTRELTPIDLNGGEPVWTPRFRNNDLMIVGVGVDENGDGIHDRKRERVRTAIYTPEKKALEYLTP